MVDSGNTDVQQGLSRRRLVQGAAWAVPVVMVASAAPALAASQGIVTIDGAKSCKLPGSSFGSDFKFGYYFTYCVNNPSTTLTMSGTIVWDNPLIPTQTFNIAAGDSACYSGYVYSSSSANISTSATVTYQIGTHPQVITSVPLVISGFDPCCVGKKFCPPGCTEDVCPPPPA